MGKVLTIIESGLLGLALELANLFFFLHSRLAGQVDRFRVQSHAGQQPGRRGVLWYAGVLRS